eukprot:15365913-Ditylum_brightwellii.AAC.1
MSVVSNTASAVLTNWAVQIMTKLQQWKKGGFVCGNKVPIDPYTMTQQLHCWDHMELRYYESKGAKLIWAIFCSEEDVLSSEEIEKQHTNLGENKSLPLCVKCAKQDKAAKATKHANAVKKGLQRPTECKK